MKSKWLMLLLSTLVVSTQARADKLDADGILRKNDGSIREMSQYDAVKACPEGTRLMTAREQAMEAQARGAIGILEVSQVKAGVPEGYYKISAIDPDGIKDEFYFLHYNYKRPSGDLGNTRFWSSSVYSYDSAFGYSVNSYYGYVGAEYYRDSQGIAVRCVAGQ